MMQFKRTRDSNGRWLFVGGLTFLLVALAALYPGSELHRRNTIGQLASDFFNTLHSQKLKR